MYIKSVFLWVLFSLIILQGYSQDSTAVTWQVSTVKSDTGLRLNLHVHIKPGWALYAPNQDLSGTPSMELNLADSAITPVIPFLIVSGRPEKKAVALFENKSFELYTSDAAFYIQPEK